MARSAYIGHLLAHPTLRRARELVTKPEPFTAEFPALPEGRIEIAGSTDLGLIREHNEDSFLIGDLSTGETITENGSAPLLVDSVPAVLIVADGVGGSASGEVASSMATQIAFDHLRERFQRGGLRGTVAVADALQQALFAANAAIHSHARQNHSHHGMGTTATLALVVHGMVYFSQIGDSRAYIVRGESVTQMTKDQSLVQRMVDAGKMTAEQAERSEHRNIILQALGPEGTVVPELTRDRLQNGDVLILCSDGLSNQITIQELARAVADHSDLEALCEALVARALETGAPDNVTVVAARFSSESKSKSQSPAA